MNMQSLATAVLKRLLVSLAIFAVGFVAVCVLLRVALENRGLAFVGALPGGVTFTFVVVSLI